MVEGKGGEKLYIYDLDIYIFKINNYQLHPTCILSITELQL